MIVQTYEPGQGNNAYIFPGAALGIITAGIHHISGEFTLTLLLLLPTLSLSLTFSLSADSVFLSAAEALSDMVTDADLSVGRLYPPLGNIREISVKIATKVATEAYQGSTASTYPEPEVRNEAPPQTLTHF